MPVHKPDDLGCLTQSQAVPKLRTHNLVCRLMHVSEWLKRPNMVPRPNLGGKSIFHPPLGPLQGRDTHTCMYNLSSRASSDLILV